MTYTCRINGGTILWVLNGRQVATTATELELKSSGLYISYPNQNISQLTITVSFLLNGFRIGCINNNDELSLILEATPTTELHFDGKL